MAMPTETALRAARDRFNERHANTHNALKQYLACVDAENSAYIDMITCEKSRD